MFEKTVADDSFDSIFGIEDCIDAAIIRDEYANEELEDMKAAASAGAYASKEEMREDEESLMDEDDDLIDSNMDYTNDLRDPDPIEAEAIEYIAAERELAKNPFEEDELIDIAINGDLPSDLD